MRALASPLDDLHFFEASRAEPRTVVEKGRPGALGYQRWEYWPRTREYMYEAVVSNPERPGTTRVESWCFDARTGAKMVRDYREPSAPERHVTASDIPEFNRLLSAAARKLDAPAVDASQRRGLPEVVTLLRAVMSRPQADPTTLAAGELIAFGDDRRLIFTSVARLEPVHWGGLDRLRVYTRGDPRVGGSGYTVDIERGPYMPAGYITRAPRFGVDGGAEVIIGTLSPNDATPTRCWRVTDREMATIVAHRPRVIDPTVGTAWTPASVTLHVALQALQSTRWAASEIDAESRGNRKTAATLRTEHRDVTREHYAHALDALIGRFGTRAFAEAVTALFDAHLHGLHTRLHQSDLPYGPHSDTAPLDSTYMRLAREATLAVHPTPRDMGAHGHVVNVRTLFGDEDFWRHLRDHYRGVFDRAVDHLLALPSPMKLRGVYGRATADAVAVVRDFFPAAYREIRVARPDFASTAEVAFQLARS